MLFDAHAFKALGGVSRLGIYDNVAPAIGRRFHSARTSRMCRSAGGDSNVHGARVLINLSFTEIAHHKMCSSQRPEGGSSNELLISLWRTLGLISAVSAGHARSVCVLLRNVNFRRDLHYFLLVTVRIQPMLRYRAALIKSYQR